MRSRMTTGRSWDTTGMRDCKRMDGKGKTALGGPSFFVAGWVAVRR
jgi:hypothetical protein